MSSVTAAPHPADDSSGPLGRFSRPLPDWALLVLLAVLALLFMRRALLAPPGETMGGFDVRSSLYAWSSFAVDALRNDQIPFWNPYSFAGEPFLSNPHTALFYPPQWLVLALPLRFSYAVYVALHLWLAGAGMYLLIKRWTGHRLAALLAAFMFMFGGFTAGRIAEGHLNLFAALVWTPWVLWAYHGALDRGTWWAGLLAGLPFGLALLAGNPPILIYMAIIWGSDILLILITQPDRWLTIRQAGLASLAAIGLAAGFLFPFVTIMRLSTRNLSEFVSGGFGAMPLRHLITLLVPGFYGDYVVGYWGATPFHELTWYAGLLPLVLLPVALRRPSPRIWWALALMVFGLLAANTFVSPLLRAVLVPLGWVRAPGRAAFLYSFAASILIGETLARLPEHTPRLPARRWLRLAGVGELVLGGGLWLAAIWEIFHSRHLHVDVAGRWPHQLAGLTAAAAGMLILVILLRRAFTAAPRPFDTWRRLAARGALAVFVLADVTAFSLRFVLTWPAPPDSSFAEAIRALPGGDYRYAVDGNPAVFDDAILLKALAIDGYNPIRLAAQEQVRDALADAPFDAPLYDVLAVGYVVSEKGIDDPAGQSLESIGQAGGFDLYRRTEALPLARLVGDWQAIPDTEEALNRLAAGQVDPAETAILSAAPPCQTDPADSGDRADIVMMEPGRWQIDTRSAGTALLVLSETSYPGWRVTVDGQRAQPLVAYTSFKAVCVPPGQHRVEWRYIPPGLAGGVILSSVTVVLLVVCAIRLRADNVHRQGQGESQLV